MAICTQCKEEFEDYLSVKEICDGCFITNQKHFIADLEADLAELKAAIKTVAALEKWLVTDDRKPKGVLQVQEKVKQLQTAWQNLFELAGIPKDERPYSNLKGA